MDRFCGHIQKMIDKKTFKKSVGGALEQAGFVKKGQSWYFEGEDALVLANLEKIDVFDEYVINIGIWLKAFGDTTFPAYNQCHLYYRVERLFPSQRELILASCSLLKSDNQILANLSEFIKNQLVPFLKDCTDESKLKELMSEGVLKRGFVRKEARMFLADE